MSILTCHIGVNLFLLEIFTSEYLNIKAVQLVCNPLSQIVPQLNLYSQLQLILWSDPINFSVPKSTW